MKIFDLGRKTAVKVRFKNFIFEDDFPEEGMVAWFTGIEECREYGCYKLYFDFTEFEAENEKYFRADYYNMRGIPCLTAKEIGLYNPKYSVYFGNTLCPEEENDKYLSESLEIIE